METPDKNREIQPSELSSPSVFPRPAKMSDQQLVEHLRQHFFAPLKRRLKDHLPYLREARRRFSQRGRRVPIKGRPTFGEFCEKELGISIRQVQKLLAGGGTSSATNRRKQFWLTPPDLMEQIKAEFGNCYDPCPHPRPKQFDGLKAEWGAVNYVNPPFGTVREKGKRIGITHWVKKILTEQEKGKTSVLVFPTYSWFHLLLGAGAEMRSLGEVKWISIKDGSAQKTGLPIVMFVVREKKQGEPGLP
jgi:hypothetical protein